MGDFITSSDAGRLNLIIRGGTGAGAYRAVQMLIYRGKASQSSFIRGTGAGWDSIGKWKWEQ
jgi:hypothetical protein